MRVTQNSAFIPYQSSLEDIQYKINKEQAKLSSGNNIINILDNPAGISRVKNYSDLISQNTQYQNNVQSATNELQFVSDTLESITQNFQNVKDYTLEATQAGNSGNLPTVANEIKGVLNQLIQQANSDYNGKYCFSGTLTTPDSINPTAPATTDQPFELVQGTATTSNPSGLEVLFKGNLNDRQIYTDSSSKETINVKADNIFGTGGTQALQSIVDIYNTIMYKSDGTQRSDKDTLNTTDSSKISDDIATISSAMTQINATSSLTGAKLNRLDSINQQLVQENTMLNNLKSQDADTDVSKSAVELAKEQTALQYSLQVGAKLVQQTLFDFIQ